MHGTICVASRFVHRSLPVPHKPGRPRLQKVHVQILVHLMFPHERDEYADKPEQEDEASTGHDDTSPSGGAAFAPHEKSCREERMNKTTTTPCVCVCTRIRVCVGCVT